MDSQTVMMTMQLCETLAKKDQEDGLSKEEALTYEKILITIGNYMRLTSLDFEKQITLINDDPEEGSIPK